MEKDRRCEGARQVLVKYLEEHEMRKTPERFAMLDSIYTQSGHFNAEQLHKRLVPNMKISLATVYNNLDLFLRARLIVRHDVGDSFMYERAMYIEPHYHYVCEFCREMFEVKDQLLLSIIQNRKVKRFQPSHFTLYIYGTCAKCKSAMQRKETKKKK